MTISPDQALIPSAFTRLLFEYLEDRGEDPTQILGVPAPSSTNDTNHIPFRQWESMLQTAAEHLQDRYLGLKLGEKVEARHLGAVGHLLLVCPNFGTALQRLEDYQRLIFDFIPMHRRETGEWIDMVWDISENRTTVLVGEAGFASMVNYCRSIIKGEAQPLRIEFAHPAPDDIQPYEDFFQCPVVFGTAEPFIRLSHQLLEMPLVAPDPALELILDSHAQSLLSRLSNEASIVEQVRKCIASTLRNGEPDVENVSTMLNQSARTLQRNLTAAGTSFRKELTLIRNELAQAYLNDPQMRISDIAMLLGYSEHSAFTRAFRKHSGQTPQQVREQVTQELK